MSRVLIFGSFAPTLSKFRLPLIRDLVGRGHEVVAWSPDDAMSDHAALIAKAGARYEPIEFTRNAFTPLADWKTRREIIRRLRSLRPDTVLLYSAKPIVLGAGACKVAGIPRVVAMVTGLGYLFHGTGPIGFLRESIARIAYTRALSHADGAIFHNAEDAEAFRSKGLLGTCPSIVTAGSGVDLDEYPFAPLPSDHATAPIVLMAARFLREKGVEEFLQAARLVRRTHPTVRFHLAGFGDGGPSEVSDSFIRQFVASHDIELLGRIPHLRDTIARASIVVVPSWGEGLSHILLEAASTGRTVVTTDVAGCRDAIEVGSTGILVPPREVRSLADALLVLLAEPHRVERMGVAARLLAERSFDGRRVAAIHASAILGECAPNE
ncbi:MAG: glycosyltransferase family 4 protein [Planctomycetota bacterium]|nr:glycosyltransferase family 4 protein [Planctomycetota bacterium]